jgi:hypothetical protein
MAQAQLGQAAAVGMANRRLLSGARLAAIQTLFKLSPLSRDCQTAEE